MNSGGPHEPRRNDLGRDQIGRSVDTAVGSGYDRAFALLDDLATDGSSGCLCQRCRTRLMMLGLVLRRELRLLDERLSGRWLTPP